MLLRSPPSPEVEIPNAPRALPWLAAKAALEDTFNFDVDHITPAEMECIVDTFVAVLWDQGFRIARLQEH